MHKTLIDFGVIELEIHPRQMEKSEFENFLNQECEKCDLEFIETICVDDELYEYAQMVRKRLEKWEF